MYLPIVRTRMDSNSFPYAETDVTELAICHISASISILKLLSEMDKTSIRNDSEKDNNDEHEKETTSRRLVYFCRTLQNILLHLKHLKLCIVTRY